MKPESRKFILQNTSLGALFGAVLGIGFMWLIGSDIGYEYIKYGTYGITALVTLAASALALSAALASIENQNLNDNSKQEASLSAAKAVLPLALTELNHICDRGAELSLKRNVGTLSSAGEIIPSPLIDELRLSSESISSIKEAIQFSNLQDKRHLADLVRAYQILFSRTQYELRAHPEIVMTNPEAAVDWAILARMVGNCYEFAREEVTHIPDRLEYLNLEGFFSVRIELSTFDTDLKNEIERRQNLDDPRTFLPKLVRELV